MKNRIFINTLFTAVGATTAAFAVSPADVLSDSQSVTQLKGVTVRKGTIAATMLNAKAFDEIQKISDLAERKMAHKALREEQSALIDALDAVGLFEFFTPIEWLKKDGQNEGRAWVALLYLQRFPRAISEEMKRDLKTLALSASSELLEEIIACGIDV